MTDDKPFSDLTKDLSPERREKIEKRKEELRRRIKEEYPCND